MKFSGIAVYDDNFARPCLKNQDSCAISTKS